jgi:hypothetical protein
MRKITKQIAKAFITKDKKSIGNTLCTGNEVFLHGHKILWRNKKGELFFNMCGWGTVTTRERINGILQSLGLPIGISQRKGKQFINNRSTEEFTLILDTQTVRV